MKILTGGELSASFFLTLTVTRAMNYLVVEDYIPSGSEIMNRQLKTAAQRETTSAQGRGWWYFTPPLVYEDHVRWMAQSVRRVSMN